MRGTVHLLALTLACFAVACAPMVEIAIEEREPLSQSRRWDWRPDVSSVVDAAPHEAAGLHVRLAQLIDQALVARGFERSTRDADFFVTYDFELRRQLEVATVPLAPYRLDSLHESPSYVIEGSRTEERLYQTIRLSIDVTEEGGRSLWQATLRRRVDGHASLGLEDAVATLLEDFPRSARQAE